MLRRSISFQTLSVVQKIETICSQNEARHLFLIHMNIFVDVLFSLIFSLRDPGAKKVSTGVPKTSVQDMGGKKFSNVPKLSVQDMSTSRSVADDLSSAVQDSLECIDICTGSVDDLDSIILILVRLSHGMHFVEIEDEPVYVRFLILILGPPQQEMMYRQIGRSMSTLMANEVLYVVYLFDCKQAKKLSEMS